MTRRDPAWLRRVDALYALALHLYPRRFRNEWEADMRQAFRDRCREVARGERKPLALFSEIVPDLAAGAGREQLHYLQDAAMFKRNLAIALLFLFAALLVFQPRVSDATSAVQQWWTQRQERLVDEAMAGYRVALGDALAARASTPRDHAIAGLLYAGAHDSRAQAQWDRAVEAGDPLALWMSASGCPVAVCNGEAASTALARLEPGNAFIGHLRLDRAMRANDPEAARSALHAMATSDHYRTHHTELVAGLLQAVEMVPVPAKLRRYYRGEAGDEAAPAMLALALATRVAPLPVSAPLPDYCTGQDAGPAISDCLAATRLLADSGALMARIVGLKSWQRLQAGPELDQRLRDQRWLIAHAGSVWGPELLRSDLDAWLGAWLASSSEVEVYHRLMRHQGIPVRAPADFPR